ncbi:LysM peptidoglycan-binding domain-containing protein [Acidimicrobiaceae bacterium USS-CC1]|uniref:LysM peptidoglycan-binding domain-containing protein n=1 Tax=Acidiferrimicrobium australe TaxID=2664430 RepID=A0ABW9QU53_9ACTN|nr:LysM peptidoglycan-binding domain-containing protein [Acidiferrimicrobium australe]
MAGRYTVRAGDTLGAIAARFGTTVGRLAAFNHVANPNQIVVGQVIRIPGRGVATSSSSATPAGAASPGAGGTTTGGTTTGAAAPGAPESAQAAVAVRTALAQVGKPYQWAGAGPDSFDCSGLVMYAWEAAGVFLPHYTVSQMDDTTRIRASQLEPGDIVFYDTPSGAQPGHEAMYIGGGQVVSANNVGTDVQTQSITYDGPPVAFGRVG